jgi:hypothetical protein
MGRDWRARAARQASVHPTNFFPNYQEYSIAESLAAWYRIVIVSSHEKPEFSLSSQDGAAHGLGRRHRLPLMRGTAVSASGDRFLQRAPEPTSRL